MREQKTENSNPQGLEARIRACIATLSLFTKSDTGGRVLTLADSAGMERRWLLPASHAAEHDAVGRTDEKGAGTPGDPVPDFGRLVADFSDADGVIDLSLTDITRSGTGSGQSTIPLQLTITLSPQGDRADVWIESDRYDNANRQFELAADDDLARLTEFVKLFEYLMSGP